MGWCRRSRGRRSSGDWWFVTGDSGKLAIRELFDCNLNCIFGRGALGIAPFFCWKEKLESALWRVWEAFGVQHAAPLRGVDTNQLGSGGAGDAVFEEGNELSVIAGRR